MPPEDEEQKPEQEETYLGHPVKKCKRAYAEGAERGPTAKPRTRSKKD
jgi:hypothetical protein